MGIGPQLAAQHASSALSASHHVDANDTWKPPFLPPRYRFLPTAGVDRIIREALPPHARVSKGATRVIQQCVSEFISFLTSEAGESRCMQRRKSIGGKDILKAMQTLGFDDYLTCMQEFLLADEPSDDPSPPSPRSGSSSQTSALGLFGFRV